MVLRRERKGVEAQSFLLDEFALCASCVQLCSLLCGCRSLRLRQGTASTSEQSFVFGTRVEVTIYGEEEARARQRRAGAGRVRPPARILHAWKPAALTADEAALRKPGKAAIMPG